LKIAEILKKRILILDGAMGSLIQNHQLNEQDFRSDLLQTHPCNIKGNNDILSLTKPDIIKNIHLDYLKAGADIIETNTLNANSISQADYQLEDVVFQMNMASATIAKEAAQQFSTEDKPRFVAGSIGPTNKTASISPDINHPEYRDINFDILKNAYMEQIEALIKGGVDLLLLETVFDLINCKAAVFAANEIFKQNDFKIPLMISITISPQNGRILSGQTIEAFYNTFASLDILSFGLNCSAGTKDLIPFVRELDKISSFNLSVYPNAGLPDESGNYGEDPKTMIALLQPILEDKCLNIVGGCCGTTPDHIRLIADLAGNYSPRILRNTKPMLKLSGLEPLNIDQYSNFINIGERTNVAGSKKFARLISKKKYSNALKIAKKQIVSGANIIDLNMDDPLIEAEKELSLFLNMINSEPEISKVPIMIDSSDWRVIEGGLKCLNGKGIVNSISLKEGEEEFLKKAGLIRQYCAAVVVMAIDEKGQAVDYQHKIEICNRSYHLLIDRLQFAPQDIIFDPNVLTIGTGISEHSKYAEDFIKAISWIKQNLPYCNTSGGISNLSFAFRGNDFLREAIHSIFLYYAIKEGLNMAIVNAGKLLIFEELAPSLKKAVEDLIFDKTPNATRNLLKIAAELNPDNSSEESDKAMEWRNLSIEDRIKYALIHGETDYLNLDCQEIIKQYKDPVLVLEGPVMDGISKVGKLFSTGRMFLPQVVKAARVMRNIVDFLLPYFKEDQARAKSAGKVLLATVKGEVHDIGKNIVGIILG
jgi:5-methyltetrahydrofolate--homocysteine methyltransferase